jgi:hypothetical protein
MRGQVYIDILIVVVMGMLFITILSMLAIAVSERALRLKIEEELGLVIQQTATAISRFAELGAQNPIEPANNTVMLLGLYHLDLPAQISGRNWELELITQSDLWANVRNFTINGEVADYQVITPGPHLVARTVQYPEVEVSQAMPNLAVRIQGKYGTGAPPYLRYYRYNLNGTVYDAIVLSVHLVIHLEVLD